ncbi:MAG: ABC transporter permease subunit [Lentisphaerae bacterium]|nr:ABC transporter permease subunit [Lentisphaerota bacterium]
MTKGLIIAVTVWLKVIRKKDVYVLLILLSALLSWLTTMNIFGLGGTTRYVSDTGLLLAWFLAWILAVNVSARELPEEENRGTIFSLLAKPITRAELIIGKWLGAWTVVCTANAVFYLAIWAIVAVKSGYIDPSAMIQGFVLHCFALAIITAIGIAFSTRMNFDAAATISFVFTGASLLLLPRIPEFAVKEKGLRAVVMSLIYHGLPHFDILDMRQRIVHDYGPVDVSTMAALVIYAMLLTVFFLVIAWLAYRKKLFSRSELM